MRRSPQDQLRAAKERDPLVVGAEHGRRPDVRGPAEVLGHAFAADLAFARAAEEVALQLDGGEVLRLLWQMGDAGVAGAATSNTNVATFTSAFTGTTAGITMNSPGSLNLGAVSTDNTRTTATQQTGFSFIAQMRSWLPNPIGGIFWFGVDDAASTVYIPIYCAINHVPESFAEQNGDMLTYSPTSAFWIFNRVANFAYLRYDLIIQDIRKVQSELETKFATYSPVIDLAALKLWESNPKAANEFLTDYSVNMANYTVQRWQELSNWLLIKYIDGNVKKEKDGNFIHNPWGYPVSPSQPGYPDSWKKTVIEDTGEKLIVPEKKK